MEYKVAVVGATGNVGRRIIDILHERQFPISELVPLSSRESMGKQLSFGKKVLKAQVLDDFDFVGTDIVLSSAGSAISQRFAEKATAAGAVIIDNTSHFRMDPQVPLVVPEVNFDSLKDFANKNIIANPNCNVIPIVVALKPLHDMANIKRIVISTYQSVSGAGKRAMDELYSQTKSVYLNDTKEAKEFHKQIAFNILPHVGDFDTDGYTEEESKTVNEIQKIMGKNIQVSATCVRVPVFIGHSASINVEFHEPIDADAARKLLRSRGKGLLVVDDPKISNYMTPLDCVGDDEVYISRIRNDNSQKNTLNMWVVSDNLRKGAALNTVQIAEELINNYL